MADPAPPPTRPALRARYDRRRRGIVDGAAREFARRGYDQTTMHELAASLELATGALYHYFPSKDALLRAICDELMAPLLERAGPVAHGEGTAAQRLRAVVRLWVGHVCTHRDHMRVFQQELHRLRSGGGWRSVREPRKRFERLLGELLDEAGGTAAAPLSRLALLGMVNHTAQWYRPRGGLSPERIADGYVDLVLGLG
jgi:AcrR family transcriptional regulator